MSGRVRVYIATSIDGFIAGPDDDLSWLPGADPAASTNDVGPPADPDALTYEAFMADVGALLMGRRTYDVVAGFDMDWPYGETPVLVATTRRLDPPASSVRVVSGDVGDLVRDALEAANGRDVYLDGGNLIRQALDAGLVDEVVTTIAPVVLGRGHSLFAGVERQHAMQLVAHRRFTHGMVQLVWHVDR
ncbi:MAG: dihydrofolate reductase family protein [Phycisphaerales bacterium]|nr:dihydrofolate reductase family protein [Phycisphaerales bacterium]